MRLIFRLATSKILRNIIRESRDVSFCFCFAGADYQNDAAYDYNYENQDYVEEPQPSLIPQFTTKAEHFKVAKDRILRLPCRVDQLGKKRQPVFVGVWGYSRSN